MVSTSSNNALFGSFDDDRQKLMPIWSSPADHVPLLDPDGEVAR
jgi:hypothetical protein